MSNLIKQAGSEECAHSTDLFTRGRIASKIKQIRAKCRKALDTGRQSGGGRIVATFYKLCCEIWSGSPATESIQAGLETVESLKAPVDEKIDPLERVSKESNDVELGEEEDVDDEAIAVVIATSSISFVTSIQQNLPWTSAPTQPSPSEISNKTSRGQTSREKMDEMLENRKNKRIQRKQLPRAQTSTNSEEEKFQQNLLERIERHETFFEKVCKVYKRTCVL